MKQIIKIERMRGACAPEPASLSASPSGYALGDKVRLLQDIWQDSIDGLVPAGYLARKGEVLVVKKVIDGSNVSFGIAHENRTDDNFFWVADNEIERA